MAVAFSRDLVVFRRGAPASGFVLFARPGDRQDEAEQAQDCGEDCENPGGSGFGQCSQLETPP